MMDCEVVSKIETIFRTLQSFWSHAVHTDATLFSAAFHAYGKPGKTLVETRQVLLFVHSARAVFELYIMTNFSSSKIVMALLPKTIDNNNNCIFPYVLSAPAV